MSQTESRADLAILNYSPTDISLTNSSSVAAQGRLQKEYMQVAMLTSATPSERSDSLVFQPIAALESDNPAKLQQEMQSFSAQHKVNVVEEKGQFVYRINSNGKSSDLFRTAASESGLVDGERKLAALVQAEQGNLKSTYKVDFAPAGEVVGNVRANVYSAAGSDQIKARSPELFELLGLQSALEKSVPGNIGQDGKPIKFYFLADKLIQSLNPLATYQTDKDGRSSVYIWPAMADIKSITEADLSASERRLPFTDPSRPDSIASALTHELGHNQFAKLGYNRQGAFTDGQTELTDKGIKLVNEMGWRRRRDEKDADYNWFLLGKSKDDNGQPSTYMISNTTGMMWQFARWRLDGGAVDAQGKVVPADKGQTLSTTDMAKEAAVPLPTGYFENPEEEYAEGVKLFRLGPDGRSALRDTSPILYKIIERNDQSEINQSFGAAANGTSIKVRDISGDIVDNSIEEQKRLASFDDSISKIP